MKARFRTGCDIPLQESLSVSNSDTCISLSCTLVVLAVIYLCLTFIRLSFLLRMAVVDGKLEYLLLPLLCAIVLWLPCAVVVTLLQKGFGKGHNMAQSVALGVLLADCLFPCLPVGNDLFRICSIAGECVAAVRWVKFLGEDVLSAWIVLLAYLLFRIFEGKNKTCSGKNGLLFLCTALIPVCISLTMPPGAAEKECENTVAVESFDGIYSEKEIAGTLWHTSWREDDFLLLPEGLHLTSEASLVTDPFSTILKRLSKRDSVVIICGFMGKTSNEDNYYNAVCIYYPSGSSYVRHKGRLIPFSEYIPISALLGKCRFIRESMPYPVELRKKEIDWEVLDYRFSETSGTTHPSLPNVFICYEALSLRYMEEKVVSRLNDKPEPVFICSSATFISSQAFEAYTKRLLRLHSQTLDRQIIRCVRDGRLKN